MTISKIDVYAWGKSNVLEIDDYLWENKVLDPKCYGKDTIQPLSIALHCTAANAIADISVENWNKKKDTEPASAHFVLERQFGYGKETSEYYKGKGIAKNRTAIRQNSETLVQQIIAPDRWASHATKINKYSIGIEITNVGNEWEAANTTFEETYDPAQKLPDDENCFIDLNSAGRAKAPVPREVCQAVQGEQYRQLILLLRYLCTRFDIPRQFLGRTCREMFTTTVVDTGKVDKNGDAITTVDDRYKKFRGILHHINVARKLCPGVLHRNRIYRGITDEWWMPCEFDGNPRTYYSGPFMKPEFKKGELTKAGYFKWGYTTSVPTTDAFDTREIRCVPFVEDDTYKRADIEAVAEFKSYYDRGNLSTYYWHCEKQEGIYPIGLNRVWHGGIHLCPSPNNAVVYAAASGTVVAARIHSNPDTEFHEAYGSQRFVLIRHSVHALGQNGRVDYKGTPTYVFSLYMHLERIEDPLNEHFQNPPWYNVWLRKNLGNTSGADVDKLQGDKGVVFHPDIEVSVGDALGIAGKYRDNPNCLHFEIFTPNGDLQIDNEKTKPSKDVLSDPSDEDCYCDDEYLENVLKNKTNRGLADADIATAALCLREAKTYHLSEWAVRSEDALRKIFDREIKKHPEKETELNARREEQWKHISRFTWWEESISDNTVREQLGTGFVWHYHPITFMQCINENVATDYTEIPKVIAGTPPSQIVVEGKKVRLKVRFNGIHQEPGSSLQVINGNTLSYVFWVNGVQCGKKMIQNAASYSGVSIPLNNDWQIETEISENKSLNIVVNCFDETNGCDAYDTAKTIFTKSSAPPWGAGEESRYTTGAYEAFTVYFVIDQLGSV